MSLCASNRIKLCLVLLLKTMNGSVQSLGSHHSSLFNLLFTEEEEEALFSLILSIWHQHQPESFC